MAALTSAEHMRAQRLREAELLVCRLISEWGSDQRAIADIRRESMDKEIVARDPSRVSDNLSGFPSETMYFDLQRLLTIVREVR
jgi:hypothetical protein